MGRLKAMPARLGSMPQRVQAMPKVADDFYRSAEWRALLAEIIAERGRQCQDCGRGKCRIFGDHVHEIKDGGAKLDKANVRLLCGKCHAVKTARVRAERVVGRR